MGLNRKRLVLTGTLLGFAFFLPDAFAAKVIDLNHQKVSTLQSFTIRTPGVSKEPINIEETKRSFDLNNTLHIRVRQTYKGYPVWGSEAIIHIPEGKTVGKYLPGVFSAAVNAKATMNGKVYQNLSEDLINTQQTALATQQAEKAIQTALLAYKNKLTSSSQVTDKKSELLVYIDDEQIKNNEAQAHWAYKVSFYVEASADHRMPAKPTFILDAITLQIYAQWDDIQTLDAAISNRLRAVTMGGGFGGNLKMGKLIYDGLTNNLPKLRVFRDDEEKVCYLKNADVIVLHSSDKEVVYFPCTQVDNQHDNVYWDGPLHTVNGGYSPDNDALFGGSIIKSMYKDWYGVNVLESNGEPMMLAMVVHARMDNAYWDGKRMTFGDGRSIFYPLTSIGVAAHEVSHGFTQQNSNLIYYGQSGGMNESYSDMAAQAAEQFAFAKNSWQIGPEIFKKENEALRYMDKPSKDCGRKRPGSNCSIDSADQYSPGLDVHYSSGVYNRFFYLLGTSEGWTVKKAFEVMLQANANHWTSRSTFSEGACGVLRAAADLHYDAEAIKKAFTTVGIRTNQC